MAETLVELIQEGKDITEHLTDSERERFESCESVIDKGLNTFLGVGQALADIRDNRLYRETHNKFEKYCKEVWDLSRGYADRQIGGYETMRLLESKCRQLATKMTPIGVKNETGMSEITDEKWECFDLCLDCEHRKAMANRAFKGVNIPGAPGKCTRPGGLCEKVTAAEPSEPCQEIILPINEAQTRPLTKLSPDDQVKAWGIVLEQLNEGKKLTAALVSKAAKSIKGKTVKDTVKKAKETVETTSLVSPIFRKQYQVMLDIISAERNTDYATSSPKEMVRWFNEAINIIKMDM